MQLCFSCRYHVIRVRPLVPTYWELDINVVILMGEQGPHIPHFAQSKDTKSQKAKVSITVHKCP